ncbi:hypothetical protein BgAZ_306000 [Babesia gibsoni]|uniref:Uncharacterized protein n=1 Tax=Babesia gibsoni TaxID=33632 RepID=A0AAD8LRD8_BABGI|nr:hypothetical protein BgAZ_306000 [Babesia gibsoni]
MAKGGKLNERFEEAAGEAAHPDVSNEVFRSSMMYACQNLSQSSEAIAQADPMSLPNVQAPRIIKLKEAADGEAGEADRIEYLWMPSMKVVNSRFKNRLEKYSHMEFRRNDNIFRLYTPGGGMLVFFICGFLLLACAIAQSISSAYSFTMELPYSEKKDEPINFKIDRTVAAPVYFYYKLSDFYITHKNVAYDSSPSTISTGNCKLYKTFEEILGLRCVDGKNTLNGVDEWCKIKETDPLFKLPAYPCGSISATMMTDNYMICPTSSGLTMQQVRTDKESRKKCLPLSLRLVVPDYGMFNAPKKKSDIVDIFRWIDMANVMFRSWINLPYDSTFLKPYAVLNQDLQEGEYTLYVTNNYWPADAWRSKKAVYISKPGFLGTSALVFEILVYITAGLYILTGLTIGMLYFCNFSCGVSPWRGIDVRDMRRQIHPVQPSKAYVVQEPKPYENVPVTTLPCLCPCH